MAALTRKSVCIHGHFHEPSLANQFDGSVYRMVEPEFLALLEESGSNIGPNTGQGVCEAEVGPHVIAVSEGAGSG